MTTQPMGEAMTEQKNGGARERTAKALREYQMAGRITVEWEFVPKGQRQKWYDLADVAISSFLNSEASHDL